MAFLVSITISDNILLDEDNEGSKILEKARKCKTIDNKTIINYLKTLKLEKWKNEYAKLLSNKNFLIKSDKIYDYASELVDPKIVDTLQANNDLAVALNFADYYALDKKDVFTQIYDVPLFYDFYNNLFDKYNYEDLRCAIDETYTNRVPIMTFERDSINNLPRRIQEAFYYIGIDDKNSHDIVIQVNDIIAFYQQIILLYSLTHFIKFLNQCNYRFNDQASNALVNNLMKNSQFNAKASYLKPVLNDHIVVKSCFTKLNYDFASKKEQQHAQHLRKTINSNLADLNQLLGHYLYSLLATTLAHQDQLCHDAVVHGKIELLPKDKRIVYYDKLNEAKQKLDA